MVPASITKIRTIPMELGQVQFTIKYSFHAYYTQLDIHNVERKTMRNFEN